MLRLAAHHFAPFRALACRRLVGAFVAMAVLIMPLASAFAAHHVDDAHASGLSLSQIATDFVESFGKGPAPSEKTGRQQPAHSQPVADHDCHGCGAILLPPSAPAEVADVSAVSGRTAAPFGFGRDFPTDPRPPRA